jgi:hypothetical protein
MAKKVDDHRGMPLQTAKAAAREAYQFIDRGGDSVLHVTCDPGIALFLGIEVWRIGGLPRDWGCRSKRVLSGSLIGERRQRGLDREAGKH